jgi:short-subunit dehydrogenase
MAPRRIIVITGASAGIGRATAVRLAKAGASVAICARRTDLLAQVASEIEAGGGDALPITADVTNERDMAELVRLTLSRYQRLDVMICNAGFGIAGELEDVSADQMRKLLDVNYLGTFYAARAALPIFRRQGAGHLVVVSSIVGKRGVPYMGAYSAKFAQVGLAESLRAELAGSNIHVSVVFPVSTETAFFDVMSHETGARVHRNPGPRQSADQVATAIARAIEHPAPEVYPYAPSRGLVWLNALAPGLCDRFIQRYGRKPVHDEDHRGR